MACWCKSFFIFYFFFFLLLFSTFQGTYNFAIIVVEPPYDVAAPRLHLLPSYLHFFSRPPFPPFIVGTLA